MRKSILVALAAGAFTVAGAASAQDIGSVIGSLFGLGNPYPTYTAPTAPAVVAGTVPYGAQVYSDQYGRQFYYDQYGRQVIVQSAPASTYGIVGYDAWGRPIYGTSTYGSYGQTVPYAYDDDDDR